MKHLNSNKILVIVFLLGLSLLLYPSVSDYWNSFHASRAIASYTEQVAKLDTVDYERLRSEARHYNQKISGKGASYQLSEAEAAEYEKLLDISGSGIMGYIEIPEIRCSLPVYHGVDESVLQIAVGHIPGSSLPVGGPGTHCVLSGHRGLPSAKLFTDLDKLVEGDVFLLQILDETLTYEVDQILIVLPEETGALAIEEGKDYCTLVTCTPYGINTHRMLVRGHRVENRLEDVRVTAEALQLDPVLVAPLVAAPILLLLLLWLLVHYRKK